ncbi:MAG: hypothetical protein ACRD0J_06565 [Acidimicrobiales bacterium]
MMATYGRALQQARQHAEHDRHLCACGHAPSQHLERPSGEWALVEGEMVWTGNPEYRAMVFVCRADGCGCERDHSRSEVPKADKLTPGCGCEPNPEAAATAREATTTRHWTRG